MSPSPQLSQFDAKINNFIKQLFCVGGPACGGLVISFYAKVVYSCVGRIKPHTHTLKEKKGEEEIILKMCWKTKVLKFAGKDLVRKR